MIPVMIPIKRGTTINRAILHPCEVQIFPRTYDYGGGGGSRIRGYSISNIGTGEERKQ